MPESEAENTSNAAGVSDDGTFMEKPYCAFISIHYKHVAETSLETDITTGVTSMNSICFDLARYTRFDSGTMIYCQ